MYREEKTLRILYCSTALSFGGEQKQMVQILSNLDQEHFQPIVCCIRQFEYVEQTIRDLATKFVCLQVQNRYNLPAAIRRLRQVIKEQDIDLIHMGIFGSNFAGLLTAMITGVPAVAILQTSYNLKTRSAMMSAKSATWYFKWRTIHMIHAILARIVKVHYVALSQAIKESAVRDMGLPPERVTVIPLGLKPEEYDERPVHQEAAKRVRDELCLDGAYPILLNVARLLPMKGQKELIQVMPRVLERFPQAKLLIAGDGPSLSELKQIRDNLGLQEQVLTLGNRDDIGALLQASDVFVFGSYYEGLPGAVIEAMAAGKPVVAFDIPSLRLVVQDGYSGSLIQGRDVEQFAKAIVDMAEHRDVAQNMGERARWIVKKDYDIRQNMRSLESLYRELLTPV
ncbi:glycosyltransferase family 4 protein [Chloroflexota bacterium]